ncbi:MAG TPA: tRNA (guanosine(46)-N7)-methyltransferase TrmB [Gammaproteobacteria bacterium]|jgi:tRNA (guanine-N7-)-methyltransferase|nr:tRNA (guanosine(46)-N7)-methyltransferase TrmB [Gammaproteobacteria bacterium]
MNEEQKLTRQSIRSFVVRSGRTTPSQKRSLERFWPQYGISYQTTPIAWEAQFGRPAPLWLEIGFGNGVQTASLAAMRPELNILGIEIHLPGVGHLLKLAAEQELNNIRLLRHDAVDVLNDCVSDNSLDRVLLFFPDPWPKKRHHKRRIVQAGFVNLVAQKLRPGGHFHLATDWEPYAEWMLEALSANPDLSNTSASNDFVNPPDYRTQTKFEKRGRQKGHGVWDLLFKKTVV